jgi:hypothetical protein
LTKLSDIDKIINVAEKKAARIKSAFCGANSKEERWAQCPSKAPSICSIKEDAMKGSMPE